MAYAWPLNVPRSPEQVERMRLRRWGPTLEQRAAASDFKANLIMAVGKGVLRNTKADDFSAIGALLVACGPADDPARLEVRSALLTLLGSRARLHYKAGFSLRMQSAGLPTTRDELVKLAAMVRATAEATAEAMPDQMANGGFAIEQYVNIAMRFPLPEMIAPFIRESLKWTERKENTIRAIFCEANYRRVTNLPAFKNATRGLTPYGGGAEQVKYAQEYRELIRRINVIT